MGDKVWNGGRMGSRSRTGMDNVYEVNIFEHVVHFNRDNVLEGGLPCYEGVFERCCSSESQPSSPSRRKRKNNIHCTRYLRCRLNVPRDAPTHFGYLVTQLPWG